MSLPNIEEAVSTPAAPVKRVRPRRWLWILGGIVALLGLTAGGAYLGYQDAIRQRLAKQAASVAMDATEQFQRGLGDLDAKNYSQARDRFEYVIRLDPKFPGARDKLTEALFHLSVTATPTLEPTPTLAPTPDLRGVDQLFSQARQNLANKDWDKTIQALDALRKANLQYHPIEVDGMYYVALRSRGADKILKLGQLQEGLYDLALAERFGPLDSDANGYRAVANLYLTGAAYWKVDWAKSLDAFDQVNRSYPGLRDTSGIPASERYRLASIGYADQLMTESKPCDAIKYYQNALDMSQDPTVQEKNKQAQDACSGPPKPPSAPTQAPPAEAPTAPPADPTAAT
jgi:tetratricopeptide (TPR) repeat protein